MISQNDPDVYEVEKIIAKRKIKGKTEYRVKWLNYPSNQNTWEPLQHLVNAYESIKEFQQSKKKKEFQRSLNNNTDRILRNRKKSPSPSPSIKQQLSHTKNVSGIKWQKKLHKQSKSKLKKSQKNSQNKLVIDLDKYDVKLEDNNQNKNEKRLQQTNQPNDEVVRKKIDEIVGKYIQDNSTREHKQSHQIFENGNNYKKNTQLNMNYMSKSRANILGRNLSHDVREFFDGE